MEENGESDHFRWLEEGEAKVRVSIGEIADTTMVAGIPAQRLQRDPDRKRERECWKGPIGMGDGG